MVMIPAEKFNLPFGTMGHLEVQAYVKEFDHRGRSGPYGDSFSQPIGLHERGREYAGQYGDFLYSPALLYREGGAIQVLWKLNYNFALLGRLPPTLFASGRGNILQSWSYLRQVRDGVLQQLSPVERPVPAPIHHHDDMDVVVEATSQDYRVGVNDGELTCWLNIGVAHSSGNSVSFSVKYGPATAGMGSSSAQHRGASVICRVRVRYRNRVPGDGFPLMDSFQLQPRSARVR